MKTLNKKCGCGVIVMDEELLKEYFYIKFGGKVGKKSVCNLCYNYFAVGDKQEKLKKAWEEESK